MFNREIMSKSLQTRNLESSNRNTKEASFSPFARQCLVPVGPVDMYQDRSSPAHQAMTWIAHLIMICEAPPIGGFAENMEDGSFAFKMWKISVVWLLGRLAASNICLIHRENLRPL